MNRKVLVTQLWKEIRELEDITEGFLIMSEYPENIVQLVVEKSENIKKYILQLGQFKAEMQEISIPQEMDYAYSQPAEDHLSYLNSVQSQEEQEINQSEENLAAYLKSFSTDEISLDDHFIEFDAFENTNTLFVPEETTAVENFEDIIPLDFIDITTISNDVETEIGEEKSSNEIELVAPEIENAKFQLLDNESTEVLESVDKITNTDNSTDLAENIAFNNEDNQIASTASDEEELNTITEDIELTAAEELQAVETEKEIELETDTVYIPENTVAEVPESAQPEITEIAPEIEIKECVPSPEIEWKVGDNESEEPAPVQESTIAEQVATPVQQVMPQVTAQKFERISDIKQAISFGDRFRFQRDLFKNGEEMNKTIHQLNKAKSYNEALAYISKKHKWDNDNDVAEEFLTIVKRRFL